MQTRLDSHRAAVLEKSMPDPGIVAKAPEERLIEKLKAAVSTAVELRIVTYVGKVDLKGTLKGGVNDLTVEFTPPAAGEQAGRVILTSVNLAQGDILNVIPPDFGSEADKAMLAFHTEQVKEGKEIVARNLEMIAKLGKQLVGFVKG